MTSYRSSGFGVGRAPVEVITNELYGCVNGYVGAPQVAALIVTALRNAGYIIVRSDAIRMAQAHEREQCRYETANDNRPSLPVAGTFG